MEMSAWLLAGWLAIFVVSVAPAFMPPTWAVLAAFYVGSGVPLWPLTLGAAVAGALGRMVLARATRHFGRFLRTQDRRNAEALGDWFNRRGRWRWPLVAAYSLGPFPSNALFIAAGAGRVPLWPIAVTFALCRAGSDTLWVWTSARVVGSAWAYITDSMTDWRAIALQVLGLAGLVLIFRLPWARWLGMNHRDIR